MRPQIPLRPGLISYWSPTWTLLLCVALATLLSAVQLDLFGGRGSEISSGGAKHFREFFEGAFAPTLTSEVDSNYDLSADLLDSVQTTIFVAFAAMGLAILVGFILGCLASEALWEADPVVMENARRRFLGRVLRPAWINSLRTAMGFVRSVHEIFWAMLAIGLFGLNLICGILALALPYAATLGRIYAEILDETPRDGARAMRALGAGRLATFAWALLPRAASSMLSYTFYRFDCALRSSAILGFVGFPTLGLNIFLSVRHSYYHEAWTYLYVLFALLVLTESLSGLLRRRMSAWR